MNQLSPVQFFLNKLNIDVAVKVDALSYSKYFFLAVKVTKQFRLLDQDTSDVAAYFEIPKVRQYQIGLPCMSEWIGICKHAVVENSFSVAGAKLKTKKSRESLHLLLPKASA